jgi:hypothetical protein
MHDGIEATGQLWVTGPGKDMGPLYHLELDDVRYEIAFCGDPTPTIFNIETRDENFVSPEGIRVGSSLKKVDSVSLSWIQLSGVNHAGHSLCLPSGWLAYFDPAAVAAKRPWRRSKVIRMIHAKGICGK